MENIYDIVVDLLKSNERYLSEDRNLLKANVYSDAMTMNKELIEILLKNDATRKKFFVEVNNNYVFDKQGFAWFVEEKEFLPDSYTKYTNKIGLTSNGKFVNQNNDVVIDFPFKDCVLEGGQTKEDQKRDEIFFNETIASDEISRMLSPKIFTNIKKYSKDGEEKILKFDKDDNLIIKGNNLIVLTSLLKRYRGKIKSIFVDPPYYFNKNKDIDAFNYNSSFKLSTWLTFCKNRFEIAKDLLSDDGILIITMGIDGYSQLKLLLDEIFNVSRFPKNYIGTISWRKTDNQSNIGDFANVMDYILLYRKNENTKLYNLPLTEKAMKEYSYEDKKGKYRRSNILDLTRGRYKYNIETPDGSILSGPWMIEEKEYKKLLENDAIHWPNKGQQIPYGKTYLTDSIDKGQISSDFWDASYGTNQRAADEIKALFGGRVFDFSKPERLIMNLLTLTTKKDDIVLDFFMGSATAPAVALKMNRRFIGVEQLDYIEEISVERLLKVIDGENGGVSEDTNWKGGGSFIYCELKENGQELVNYVLDANENSIDEIKEKIINDDRIISYITKNEIKKADKEFNNLSLEEKKKALITLIDKNKLYINYSDIDDMNYKVTEDEKSFTKSFYEGV